MSERPADPNDFFSRVYEFTAKGLLAFEVKSWLGRTLMTRKPVIKTSPTLLNLGSGPKKLPNWVCADFYCGFRPWAKIIKPDWMIDLRYPLPCDSQIWDGLFTEHTLEHLTPPDALNLLRECHRVLKPGAWIRVVVPDLEKYVEFYQRPEGLKEKFPDFRQWKSGAEAMHSLAHHFQHLSLWDGPLLCQLLEKVGFKKTAKVEFRKGSDSRLLVDDPTRAWESLYCEAQA